MKRILFILALGFTLTGYGQLRKHRGAFKPSAGSALTYATWNPSDKSANVTLSGGDLTASGSSTGSVRATIGKSSGKWYWEVTINTLGWHVLGVGTASANLAIVVGNDVNGWGMWQDDGNCIHNGSSIGNNGGSSASDVIGLAFDAGAGTLQIYRNNSLLGVSFSSISGTCFPMYSADGSASNITANFGASAFTYTPPTGFVGLSN